MKLLILLIVLVGSLSVHAAEKVSVTGVEATCYQGKSQALYLLLGRLMTAVRAECEAKGGSNYLYDEINEKLTVNLDSQSSEDCSGVSATLRSVCL